MPLLRTVVIALPLLTRPEKEPFEDDLTIHLKKDLDLILLLFIHKNV